MPQEPAIFVSKWTDEDVSSMESPTRVSQPWISGRSEQLRLPIERDQRSSNPRNQRPA
jgi:hypothetical protein